MFTYIIVKMGFVVAEAKYTSPHQITITPAAEWKFEDSKEVDILKEAVKEAVFNEAYILCKPRLAPVTRVTLQARNATLAGTYYEDVTVWRVTR